MTTLALLAIPIGVLVGLAAGVIGLTAWPILVPLLLVFGGFPLHEVLLSSLLVDLMIAFVLLLNTSADGDHMALFYVRRFLIQPLFLLLLLPAFYFHKRS